MSKLTKIAFRLERILIIENLRLKQNKKNILRVKLKTFLAAKLLYTCPFLRLSVCHQRHRGNVNFSVAFYDRLLILFGDDTSHL